MLSVLDSSVLVFGCLSMFDCGNVMIWILICLCSVLCVVSMLCRWCSLVLVLMLVCVWMCVVLVVRNVCVSVSDVVFVLWLFVV